MNRAEQFVSNISHRSFLSLWCYENPVGRNGKELCDFLVVCDPDVIIVSVKEIKVTDSGNVLLDWRRWHKKAIDASARQIYGAERLLQEAADVTTKDGRKGLPLPDKSDRRVHRIAVALGNEGKVPLYQGDMGKGFIHVFDELSFQRIMTELDTITDFVEYLRAKEGLFEAGVEIRMEGGAGEEDLLAFYLDKGRTLPVEHDVIVVGSDAWQTFTVHRQRN